MKPFDPNSGDGFIFPGQHHHFLEDGWPVEGRLVPMRFRIVGRQGADGQMGDWEFEEGSIGDETGWLCWPNNSRPMPTWAQAFPAEVAGYGTRPAPAGATISSGSGGFAYQIFPLKGYSGVRDTRFLPLYVPPLPNQQLYPVGTRGIVVAGTEENYQSEVFFPAEHKLIAVNRAGEPDMGSLVWDLLADGTPDVTRNARLQSMMRVVPRDGKANVLSWNIGPTGQGDTEGGFVTGPAPSGVKTAAQGQFVHAKVDAANGGPFDVASDGDQHLIGYDRDGVAINGLHLALFSLWRDAAGIVDGPERYDGVWKPTQSAPFRVHARKEWKADEPYAWRGKAFQGMLVHTAESFLYTPTGGPPPTTDTPTETPPPTIEQPPPTETPPGEGDPPTDQPPVPGDTPTDSGGAGPFQGPSSNELGDVFDPSTGAFVPPPSVSPGGSGVAIPPGGGDAPPPNPGPSPDPAWPVGPDAGRRRGRRRHGGIRPWHWNPPPPPKDPNKDGALRNRTLSLDVRPLGPPVIGPDGKPIGEKPGPVGPLNPPLREPIGPTPSGTTRAPHRPTIVPGALDPAPSGGVPGGTTISGPSAPPFVVHPPRGAGGDIPLGPGGPEDGPKPVPGTTLELCVPSLYGRPQHISSGAADLRHDLSPQPESVLRHDRTAPLVAHIEAFGRQAGLDTGDTVLTSEANAWNYTNSPGSGPAGPGGTAPGGFVLLPPEVDMADIDTSFAPTAWPTLSKAYFIAGPNTYFGAGLPDLATGSMRSGYRWGASSGVLSFEAMSSAGASLAVLNLTSTPGVVVNEGGSALIALRVEGLAQPTLLITDPQNNRVGVNTAAPSAALHVTGSGIFTGDCSVGGKLTVGGLIDPTGLVLTEQAANPWTPAAGYGALYVRNTAPSTLRFVDDAGSEFTVLSVAAAGTGNTIPKFSASGFALGDSSITDNGTAVSVGATIMAVPAGSADTPGLAFVGDTNTGIRGASDVLRIVTGGADRWAVDGSGHFIGVDDNTYDVGAAGATRPRAGYFGTSLAIESAANGAKIQFGRWSESLTIAAAATTDSTNDLPANAVVFGVAVRVTTVIPTAATFTVTGATSGTQFDVAGGVAVAAGTTDVGTRNCPYKNGAAQKVRITPNLTPAAGTGVVRIAVFYYIITPPTS